ncbi:MAG: LamB/YcsF family protein [Pseudomonadota bacterium]
MASIDLNADMGEYQDAAASMREAALMAQISSCSIACGGHTGTAETMRTTLLRAQASSVRCGVHPSFPDQENFGRVALAIAPNKLRGSLSKQIEVCLAIAQKLDVTLYHLKPHGALYNVAAGSQSLAEMIVALTKSYGLKLYGPPGSALETQAMMAGLAFVAEGFVDRSYQPSGALVPRAQAGAIIPSVPERVHQALSLAQGRMLSLPPLPGTAPKLLSLHVKTLCIHGDDPFALETAEAISAALAGVAIEVVPPSTIPERGLS